MQKLKNKLSTFNSQLSISRWNREAGQIALVVLLIMIVMLTLGVSVAQRGLFDVRLSQQEEETSRAFQAAETGVEEALRTLAGGSGSLGTDTTYNVAVNDGGTGGFATGQAVEAGEVVVVDLAGVAGLTSVDVHFYDASGGGCAATTPPAVEAVVIEQIGPSINVLRSVADTQQRGGFGAPDVEGVHGFQGEQLCASFNVSIPGGGAEELRVRPLYAKSTIGIEPFGAALPAQFRLIRSEGQTASGVTRAVEVQRTNPQVPTIFDYVLFSGGSLTK